MKLELKHWLAYSGKKCMVYGSSDLFELRSAVPYDTEIELHLWHSLYKNCSGSSLDYSLVLHPLSDLTKNIEVDGEKFSPLIYLTNKLYQREPESFDSKPSCILWVDDHLQTLKNKKGYDNLLYWIYQDLVKWHFDLFGLIESELAIDINTLDNENKD
jgi:hypothetical protein